MSRYLINLLCAVISGLIVFIAGMFATKAGMTVENGQLVFASIAVALICYVALMPVIFKKIKHICCDFDWAEEIVKLYQSIPGKYRQSFWILFGFINLAFLFHTMHFMWGNEDWGAIRSVVDHEEGIKTGAFSAYWLQELLFDGKILPVINNLWAFFGLSLAGVLLAIYWNLPQRSTPIVVTGLLCLITPYSLSVLYFAKTSLGVCWLPAIVLTALLIAEKRGQTEIRTYLYNIVSVLLFLVALGTYMPVINFIGVAIIGQIFLKTVYADIRIKDAAYRVLQGLANFMAALMIYFLILYMLKETGRLAPENADSLDLFVPLLKMPLWIKYAFLQFALSLPFMDVFYKIVYGALTLLGLFTLIFKAPNAMAAARGLILLPLLILASLLALIFCADPAVHFARMTFFGLPFVYALMFLIIIRLGGVYLCRIGYVLAVVLIFMNFVRIAYAEKVWKFGWDAETKLAERIITRLEKMPEFDINRQYQLLQVGEKSLRAKYYMKTPYERDNGELLNRAYYPQGAAKEAYNFFYQTDFLSGDAESSALDDPQIKDYLLTKARAWPAKESLFIYGNYIVLVLDETALAQLRNSLR